MQRFWYMIIKTKALVLDLDDTLYAEFDYLKSAYRFIAQQLTDRPQTLFEKMLQQYQQGLNVFEELTKHYMVEMETLLNWYRFHEPDIQLFSGVRSSLERFKDTYRYAIITDGRSETQRNKLTALGLNNWLETVVISEEMGTQKPHILNYRKVMQDLDCDEYIYIGDNLKKDFVTANQLGWMTICLKDQGCNIHPQDFSVALEYQAKFCFDSWTEISEFLETCLVK